MSVLLVAGPGAAQTPSAPALSGRLTVRPRAMATATRTTQAGWFPLDSPPPPPRQWGKYLVYVPQPCVGARRCPLVVNLGTDLGQEQVARADKYGLILLFLPADILYAQDHQFRRAAGAWLIDFDSTGAGLKRMDTLLQQTLRQFAIDPAKIALVGKNGTVPAVAFVGGKNLDVFSRIVVISGVLPTEWVNPPSKTTEFLLDWGVLEHQGFRAVQGLRRAGHRVAQVSGLRGDEYRMEEDYDFMRWLHESWAPPAPAAPRVVAAPLPVLTDEALARMATFWKRFLQEPDSIRMTARQAHRRALAVPVGQERVSIEMVDMPALAGQYPSVAAALKQAGLTAQQHEAYRVALLSARLLLGWRWESGGERRSNLGVQGKNLAFLSARWEAEKGYASDNRFWVTGMWGTP